jgi:YjbE family integral membrane protein
MDFRILAAAGSIALVDIVLSGDNALVIGAAAARLPRPQRTVAIIWGGAGAIVLRLLCAIAATELLNLPLLRFIGGLVLGVIAIRLLLPEGENTFARRQSDRLFPAILTILAADITMSLDNVIAVGGLANGNVPVLIGGVVFSMLLLFIASSIVAQLIERFAWLLDLAAVVLAWTAANLVTDDPFVRTRIHLLDWQDLAVHLAFVAVVLAADVTIKILLLRRGRAAASSGAEPKKSADAGGAHDSRAPVRDTNASADAAPPTGDDKAG